MFSCNSVGFVVGMSHDPAVPPGSQKQTVLSNNLGGVLCLSTLALDCNEIEWGFHAVSTSLHGRSVYA